MSLALLICLLTQTEPRFVLEWGRKGDQPGEFHSPIGIAINAKDEVYVTDLNNARLQKFTAEGKPLGGFDLPPDSPKKKSSQAGGIALGADGLIYLSFMSQHRIGVYSDDGTLVREWGRKGQGDGEFDQPGGLLLAADGSLVVADQCNHRIQRFTREGKFLAKWGGHGTAPGQFDGTERAGSRFGGPHFVAQDSRGRLYTTEGALGRVQQLSPEGKPLLAWGDKGQLPGGFGGLKTPYAPNTLGPIAVFVDPHDRVWVSSLNDRVQAFTPEGKYLFGIAGRLARPHGMAMDRRGRLYVADAGNQRIQVFEVPAPDPIDQYRRLEFPGKPENFDRGWEDRVEVEFRLVNSADPKALAAALKDPDPLVRSIAARALGIRGDASAADAIAELAASDPETPVRVRAVEALGLLKKKPDVVERARKDKEIAVRWVANLAAGQLGKETDYAALVREAYASGIRREAIGAARVGRPAPDFSAMTSDGRAFKLSDVLGKKPIALYFAAYDG